MTDSIDELVAARVRAALAYAALTYEDAADVIPNMGTSTLRRIASPKNPRGATAHELAHIALACGVALDWLTRGVWSDSGETLPSPFPELGVGSRERRLAVVEHYLGQLLLLERSRGNAPAPPSLTADEQQRALPPGRRR
jgi:hypothetical protein